MIMWDIFDGSKLKIISQTIEEVGLSNASFSNLTSDSNVYESIMAIDQYLK